jgi:hypothetical protein
MVGWRIDFLRSPSLFTYLRQAYTLPNLTATYEHRHPCWKGLCLERTSKRKGGKHEVNRLESEHAVFREQHDLRV